MLFCLGGGKEIRTKINMLALLCVLRVGWFGRDRWRWSILMEYLARWVSTNTNAQILLPEISR